MTFQLPNLNYGYEDLGPFISKDIMFLHHSKHHQTYIDKLNGVIEKHPELADKDILDLIRNISELDESFRQQIINFGGGHYNHTMFWQFMTPKSNKQPSGNLLTTIEDKYGNFQSFVDEFTAKSLSVFGSGWAWLMPDMIIVTTANQDNPMMKGSEEPILGLDVWEHAYYLDYKNKRDDYVKSWWNVVNWDFVEEMYNKNKNTQ